jgi:hypothetical protein
MNLHQLIVSWQLEMRKHLKASHADSWGQKLAQFSTKNFDSLKLYNPPGGNHGTQ